MRILIIKLNAIGDVVRTTTLLRVFRDGVTWITSDASVELLRSDTSLRCVAWSERDRAMDGTYDLVINLEDELPTAQFAGLVERERIFGAYLRPDGAITYSDDSRGWFDLSLISVYGRERADHLKLLNRRTYQDLIFEGLGLAFAGEQYRLPRSQPTDLSGDVAIAPVAGGVWPMKAWAYYDQLKAELEAHGLEVNYLPLRETLLEHLSDVRNHRCLVSGDSLPMHFALGTGTPCVTLFNCTSPWEIYDYGLQTKLISPLLDRFFYKRHFDVLATTAIPLETVFEAAMRTLKQRTVAAVKRDSVPEDRQEHLG